MLRTSRLVLLIALAAPALLAQSAFDGTWALNQSKSQLTGDTMTFAPAGAGAMKFTNSEMTYTFKTDGSETTTPMGSAVTWKQQDPHTYEHTMSRNGKQLSDAKWTISSDNKTLNIDAHGTKPNGETWQNKETYTRVSGGEGLAGTWKSTSMKMSSPNTMTILTQPDGAMKWEISSEKATWQGKPDGNDYPATGPTLPDGLTLAVTKASPHSMKMTEKMKGKPLFMGTYTVAADGKTMNMHGTNAQGKEPITEVWEKQQ
jgi:hypothetical protein